MDDLTNLEKERSPHHLAEHILRNYIVRQRYSLTSNFGLDLVGGVE